MTHFTEGFVTASLVFCVAPMTILGSIQDGLTGDYSLMAIKSLLDGFAALAFASSLGMGVLFSVLTILIYQGGLTLLAGLAQNALSDVMIAEMTATGGVMILAIGLLLLDVKRNSRRQSVASAGDRARDCGGFAGIRGDALERRRSGAMMIP